MDLEWLEDFLEIASVRNFSTAAAARNISQPAYSRRIRALEDWLGAKLVDRSTSPVGLTATGHMFLPRCQQLVREIHRLRAECGDTAGSALPLISFASLTTLAVYYFPRWSEALQAKGFAFRSSVQAGDYRQSLEHLASGKSDFAIIYHHADGPQILSTAAFESKVIGTDQLIMLSGTSERGTALFDDRRLDEPDVPYLTYSWNEVYFDKLVALVRRRRRRPLNLATVYQSTLAEAIKQMAIAGRGVAWLPGICVEDALARGELVQVGGPLMSVGMEIRIYRRQGHRSTEADAIWTAIPDRTAVPADSG